MLKIASYYGGENISIEGRLNGQDVHASSSISMYGTEAKIAGTWWWWQNEANVSYTVSGLETTHNPQWVNDLEKVVCSLFAKCYKSCLRYGVYRDGNWEATINDDNQIIEIKQITIED